MTSPTSPTPLLGDVGVGCVGGGVRDQVEMACVTSPSGAFTQPIAAEHLGAMLQERGIEVEPDFIIESVHSESKTIRSFDEREVAVDLLVTVPLNMGADFVARSDLGDALNDVPVDRATLKPTRFDNIFAVGDASDIPASKAGSAGHFTYDTQPISGHYPLPLVGSMSLLKESRANHLGTLAFRWVYWNLLLPGRPLPLPARLRDRSRARRRALGGHPLPPAGLLRPRRDPDPAPGDGRRRHPDQDAVAALPAEADQEDGLCRRAAQAARLCV